MSFFDKLICKQSVIYFLLVSLCTGKKMIKMKICTEKKMIKMKIYSYVQASFEKNLNKASYLKNLEPRIWNKSIHTT